MISPDGLRVARTTSEGIEQWRIASGSTIGAPMEGHTGGINSIAYGPSGDYLVSAGVDRTLRFWDTTTGRQLGDPIITPGDSQSVTVSHDGLRVFISQNAVGTLEGQFAGSRVSELPAPAAWHHALCDKLARNPTEVQWRQWVSSDVPYVKVCLDKP